MKLIRRRHNCKENKLCYLDTKCAKLEIFDECFQRGIGFGDVDGCVERGGHFLYLEWKPAPIEFSEGQRTTFERRTRKGESTYICIAGNVESTEVTHVGFFVLGKFSGWEKATLDSVKTSIKNWFKHINSLPWDV
jgi:hypothetical protein